MIFFFIVHNDIDFKNPKDPVWILNMESCEKYIKNQYDESPNDTKYIFDKSMLNEIDVKILRDIIDASWE